jgi:hypothetical protein
MIKEDKMILLEQIDTLENKIENRWYCKTLMDAARYVYRYYKDREELTYDEDEGKSETIAEVALPTFMVVSLSIQDLEDNNLRSLEELLDVPPTTFDKPETLIGYSLLRDEIVDFKLTFIPQVPTK